jgi:hypothetical protein
MRNPAKILNLASALAALATPAAAPPIADAVDSDGTSIAMEAEKGIKAEADISLPGDVELMSFTVHQTSDGMMFPQHGSHSSHSSHSSHVSHASSSPGFGGPYVPLVPSPGYPPPVVAPSVVAPALVAPPAATTTPPPASASDITYFACTWASNGLGVNQIASELQQRYGISANEAVNIAKQALASVLGEGHYCDGYLGE